ncbi:unnamed protein product [Anisakis simplex]|uniref:28S ribosomal protein S35, mitochondrial (inferred by orthology to a human protein) n=1 Tax=Anisakis simplex TaxID=6269 RepID=A0A0M3K6I9_ANISI|nr:unnamed protein product [Anisakis simplex]
MLVLRWCGRCAVVRTITFRRSDSTLAEKMRHAAEGVELVESEAAHQKDRLETEFDEKGEPFRELFVMPHRKLNAQLQLERLTGRAKVVRYSRMDIADRLAVRRPRYEEMRTDQDWPSVWPVAASFRSSVVPLPIRMGSRPHPEKRPPFQKLGNLELMKIPNFLHLTPAAIQRHCNAIKKFCTEWPEELNKSEVREANFPVTVSYSDYVHQGTSLRDPRARVVTITLKLASFDLMIEIIVNCRCYTRKQNRDYAFYLLTALYHESIKAEAWEKMAQRVDDLKVKYDGSPTQRSVEEVIERLQTEKKMSANDDSGAVPSVQDSEPASVREHMENFKEMWQKYRNEVKLSVFIGSFHRFDHYNLV